MRVVRQPNTLVSRDDIEQHAIIVGGEHPALVAEIMEEITVQCQKLVENRGFFTYRCKSRQGLPFTLGITGIGPSATEIAAIEYASCGARVFLRVGTSGALSDALELGSVVITTEALRYDGVSDLYIGKKFRALADEEIVKVLVSSAAALGKEYAVGTTLSTAAFYAMSAPSEAEEYSPGSQNFFKDFKPASMAKLWKLRAAAQVLNVEMETATLLTLARLYRLKAGSVCGISNRIPCGEDEQIRFTESALRNALCVGVDALDSLCRGSNT